MLNDSALKLCGFEKLMTYLLNCVPQEATKYSKRKFDYSIWPSEMTIAASFSISWSIMRPQIENTMKPDSQF